MMLERAVATPLMIKLSALAALALASCHDDDTEHAGMPCAVPEDCYPEVDPAAIQGEIDCITRVDDGYCTHTCTSDTDCCAVEGECQTGIPQVCSPFESLPDMRCFLSCEPDVIGDWDETEYCANYAHPAFLCRSSGGGSSNRKICVPPGS